MGLREVELERPHGPLPRSVADFLQAARIRTDRFQYLHRDQPIHAFVACDYQQVFFALQYLKHSGQLPGRQFCEWGSGFGVVAGMAAMHDFLACGIEVEPLLVAESRSLLEEFKLDVEIAEGSFIADHITPPRLQQEGLTWVDLTSAAGYRHLDLEPVDFDLCFVYPWPGEDLFVRELFDRMAAPGALLLAYLGADEIGCWQKLSS
ncbi:MAG: hypothetical protein VX644_17245 [Planctomycetota bacterium]|nr:hypothetical protein [Planctomycetota bacterium]